MKACVSYHARHGCVGQGVWRNLGGAASVTLAGQVDFLVVVAAADDGADNDQQQDDHAGDDDGQVRGRL